MNETTVETPVRDPYAEGYDARIAGRSDSENPYDLQSDEIAHLEWNDGWAAADADEGDGL